jgi:hypothetical protein
VARICGKCRSPGRLRTGSPPVRPARIERAPARDEPAVVPGRGEAGAEVVAHSPGAHDRDPHPDFPDVDDQLTVLVT